MKRKPPLLPKQENYLLHDFFRIPRAEQKNWLQTRLQNPAPSLVQGLNDGFRLPGREHETTSAAVLVPIINHPQGLTVLFTQRSANLPDHPGQISFPGGRCEPDDPSALAAALRESAEEIGLNPATVSAIGELANYQTVTGYSVTPVVGWIEPPLTLTPDPVEVADVFEVPLDFLLDAGNYQQRSRTLHGRTRYYYAVPYQDRFIWGATAAMLLILYHTLKGDDD